MVIRKLFPEALPVLKRRLRLGLEAFHRGGNVGGPHGERCCRLAEDGSIRARGPHGAKAADEFNPHAAADLLRPAQEQGADLAGGKDMGSSAGVAVKGVDFDEADVSSTLGQLAQLAGCQHRFRFSASDSARRNAAILCDDFVGDTFHAFHAVVGDRATGEVNGGYTFPEMEGDGGRVQLAQKDGGEQMLASVLLHVVEAALPVDLAVDRSAGRKGFADEVPNLAVLVLFNRFDGNIERGTPTRDGAQDAGIAGLTAAGGIKSCAVECDLPDGLSFFAGELTNIAHNAGKRLQKRIGVVQPFRWGHCSDSTSGADSTRQIENRGPDGRSGFSLVRAHPTVSYYSTDPVTTATALIWVISMASIVLMLARPRGLPEYLWIGCGALLLVMTRLLPLARAVHAVREGVDVYLFLTGMMLLAELAREERVFDWVADIAVRHARGSSSRLFLWIYMTGTIVTALLSNDATAVVLTPAVLAAVRRAKVDPKPHLLACALIANAASFLLPIANPANLVVFGTRLPALGTWLRIFLLPSAASIGATFVCLRLLSRRALQEQTAETAETVQLEPAGRLALAGIGAASVALMAASALGISLGAPTFGAGALALVLVAIKDRKAPGNAVRSVSWGVLPLVAGLFMTVEALNQAGLMRLTMVALERLAAGGSGMEKFGSGFGVALLSNAMNNLPVGLATGSALQQIGQTGHLAHAVLIGVDLGPNLSVTGSLATILWLIALRRENTEISGWEFLKAGMVVMPVALVLALLALR